MTTDKAILISVDQLDLVYDDCVGCELYRDATCERMKQLSLFTWIYDYGSDNWCMVCDKYEAA